MPARPAAVQPLAWQASALCHAAILAMLIAWRAPPPPIADPPAIVVALIVEQASDANLSGGGRRDATTVAEPQLRPIVPDHVLAAPAQAPPAQLPPAPPPLADAAATEPAPPAPPPAALASKPPSPLHLRARIKQAPRPANDGDASLAAAEIPSMAPSPAPSAQSTTAPLGGAITGAPSPAAAPGPVGATTPQSLASAAPELPPGAGYLAAIKAWLDQHKEYPKEGRRRHEEGTVLIDFVIDRDGQVLSSNIRQSSGSSVLDAAAEEMVHRSNPLPPAPPTYHGSRLELVLPVTFKLQ